MKSHMVNHIGILRLHVDVLANAYMRVSITFYANAEPAILGRLPLAMPHRRRSDFSSLHRAQDSIDGISLTLEDSPSAPHIGIVLQRAMAQHAQAEVC